MIRVERVHSNVSGGDTQDGYACRFCNLPFQTVEVSVNGFRFPSRVGKNSVVDFREDSFG